MVYFSLMATLAVLHGFHEVQALQRNLKKFDMEIRSIIIERIFFHFLKLANIL